MGDERFRWRAARASCMRLSKRDEESVVTGQDMVEVHLEELGQHSWVKALANTIGGSYGSAQYRFVACSQGKEHHASDHAVTGATFPVMRFQDLENLNKPSLWHRRNRGWTP